MIKKMQNMLYILQFSPLDSLGTGGFGKMQHSTGWSFWVQFTEKVEKTNLRNPEYTMMHLSAANHVCWHVAIRLIYIFASCA
jgi:hypothetical protein